MMKKTGDTSELFGMKLFSNKRQFLLEQLEVGVKKGQNLTVVLTPNPEQVVQAKEQPELLTYFTEADYLLPDGVGLVVASRLLALRGKADPLPTTIPGVDVAADILNVAAKNTWTVLVVGGRDYSDTNILHYQGYPLHWTPGYSQVTKPTIVEEQELARLIDAIKPQVVFVAFGAPHQERWIHEHRALLEKNNVRIAMAVGGSFDYLLGKVPRASRLVRSLGMEWLFRLVIQPWRWRRQLRLARFVGLTLQLFFS